MPDVSDAAGRERRRAVELRRGREARAVLADAVPALEAARRDVVRRVPVRRRVVARFAVDVARFAVDVARFAVDVARFAVDVARRLVEPAARRVVVAALRRVEDARPLEVLMA